MTNKGHPDLSADVYQQTYGTAQDLLSVVILLRSLQTTKVKDAQMVVNDRGNKDVVTRPFHLKMNLLLHVSTPQQHLKSPRYLPEMMAGLFSLL